MADIKDTKALKEKQRKEEQWQVVNHKRFQQISSRRSM